MHMKKSKNIAKYKNTSATVKQICPKVPAFCLKNLNFQFNETLLSAQRSGNWSRATLPKIQLRFYLPRRTSDSKQRNIIFNNIPRIKQPYNSFSFRLSIPFLLELACLILDDSEHEQFDSLRITRVNHGETV